MSANIILFFTICHINDFFHLLAQLFFFIFSSFLFSGMDRLERLKGIPLKLMAIDQFMNENPQWLGKIVFTLIGISAIERGQVRANNSVMFVS